MVCSLLGDCWPWTRFLLYLGFADVLSFCKCGSFTGLSVVFISQMFICWLHQLLLLNSCLTWNLSWYISLHLLLLNSSWLVFNLLSGSYLVIWSLSWCYRITCDRILTRQGQNQILGTYAVVLYGNCLRLLIVWNCRIINNKKMPCMYLMLSVLEKQCVYSGCRYRNLDALGLLIFLRS